MRERLERKITKESEKAPKTVNVSANSKREAHGQVSTVGDWKRGESITLFGGNKYACAG
jgi:hypothetical protein